MPRPRHDDRDRVHEHTLSLRISERERRLLERLVEARRAELLEQTGEDVPLSAASVVRSMILREAKARGLDEAAALAGGAESKADSKGKGPTKPKLPPSDPTPRRRKEPRR